MSFALLDSSPDAELFAKAADGSLVQPEVLSAQVTRLMALPAARANLAKKVSYYLDFEALPFAQKDAASFPEFAALQSTLYQSAQLFLNDVVWSGHFSDLFTSRRIYANQAMAAAYGFLRDRDAAAGDHDVGRRLRRRRPHAAGAPGGLGQERRGRRHRPSRALDPRQPPVRAAAAAAPGERDLRRGDDHGQLAAAGHDP